MRDNKMPVPVLVMILRRADDEMDAGLRAAERSALGNTITSAGRERADGAQERQARRAAASGNAARLGDTVSS